MEHLLLWQQPSEANQARPLPRWSIEAIVVLRPERRFAPAAAGLGCSSVTGASGERANQSMATSFSSTSRCLPSRTTLTFTFWPAL